MGYWKSHQYNRRSVESIQEFVGWNKITKLIETARREGNKRAIPTGDRDAALLAALFIGGFRAGECVREVFHKDGQVEITSGLKRENVKVIKDTDQPHVLFENCMSLKGHKKIPGTEYTSDDGKRHHQTKRVPLYRIFPTPIDEPITNTFLTYVEKIKPDQYIFPITPTRAYQIVTAVDPDIWTHWFRAQRAAQLAREYGFTLHILMEFFQWKDMKTALRYASMGYHSLLEKMPKQQVARIW